MIARKLPFLEKSNIVTSEGESPPHNLTSTEPCKALEPKEGSNSCVLHLQLWPILPQLLDVVQFLPEGLITSRNTTKTINGKGIKSEAIISITESHNGISISTAWIKQSIVAGKCLINGELNYQS